MEYPKFLQRHNVVAKTEAEHRALLEGRATVEVVLKAQAGDVRAIVQRPAAVEAEPAPPEPGPLSEPAAMIAEVERTFRRKGK